jgi:hypothetical protein
VDNNGQGYREEVLSTTNTKLAAVLLLFGARLRHKVPLDYSYVHESRKNFIQHKKNENVSRPKKRVAFNFENGTLPAREIVKAFEGDIESLQAELEIAIESVPEHQKNLIRDIISKITARLCREVLEKREFLVNLINSVPEDSKWDVVQVGDGSTTPFVKMGKNSSPELRARMLSKL